MEILFILRFSFRITHNGNILRQRLMHGRVELDLGLAALGDHRALDLEHTDVILRLQGDLYNIKIK